MISILQYPFVTPYYNAVYTTRYNACHSDVIYSPLFQWLLNGKINENPVVQPTNVEQIIRPSGVNRNLETVTVRANNPKVYIRTLAVDGVSNIVIVGAATVTSDADTIATATLAGNNITVTGVAAGSTVVRVYDNTNALIGLIVVTVEA